MTACSGYKRLPMVTAAVRLLLVMVVQLSAQTVLPYLANAQSITEFPIPSQLNQPRGITTGPDGALWFTECCEPQIGRIATDGTITEFPLPFPTFLGPTAIATGSDGALWFTDSQNLIGRITTAGNVTQFKIPTPNAAPAGIAAGPDGALWFVEARAGKIGRVTTTGTFTEFPILRNGSSALSIVVGPDGNLWFTDPGATAIGRITPSGTVTEFSTGAGSPPISIAVGSDAALWFTINSGGFQKFGRITTTGSITTFNALTFNMAPASITAGPDGALWFVDVATNSIGRLTTAGAITETPIPTNNGLCPCSLNDFPNQITAGPDGSLWFTETQGPQIGRLSLGASGLLAAVLPSSRSVQVGNTATAFATIINSSGSAATGCAPAPVTSVAANFTYQTTDPATNALTGSPNTPTSIGAGKAQSFVIAFAPNAPVSPMVAMLGFTCSGFAAAPSNAGLNTLLYSASASPVPDIVALAATTQNDGILHIPGNSASGAFAVATVNVGAGATITASANTGTATLPLSITLCQTNPSSGQCLAPPAASVSTTINANATPTFAIFAASQGAVPFLPASNRIFVQFSDGGGTVRGSTSVAVATQ